MTSVEGSTAAAPTSASVNPAEVGFYTALADRWWDTSGPFWPLHRLNQLRTRFITRALRQHFDLPHSDAPLDGLAVLDIGCGGGILAESMARLGASVRGIDVVARNIEVARQHARKAGLAIRYDCETVENLAASGASYDVVLNMEVVEHVADLSGFMSAAADLVRRDGVMFVATINRNAAAWLAAIVGAEYVLRWLPKGTHRWADFRRPAEIESLLARDGIAVVQRTGVAVNPLTRQFRLTRSMPINYMLMGVREAPPPARRC